MLKISPWIFIFLFSCFVVMSEMFESFGSNVEMNRIRSIPKRVIVNDIFSIVFWFILIKLSLLPLPLVVNPNLSRASARPPFPN